MVLAFSGDPEGFHFGIIFEYILGSISAPFLNTMFGAGQPAETPNAPKEYFQMKTFIPKGVFE